jgi:hypothetical protein
MASRNSKARVKTRKKLTKLERLERKIAEMRKEIAAKNPGLRVGRMSIPTVLDWYRRTILAEFLELMQAARFKWMVRPKKRKLTLRMAKATQARKTPTPRKPSRKT